MYAIMNFSIGSVATPGFEMIRLVCIVITDPHLGPYKTRLKNYSTHFQMARSGRQIWDTLYNSNT